MTEILMIGTHHNDEKGTVKLRRVLDDFRPEIVLGEGSELIERAQWIYREEMEIALKESTLDQAIIETLLWQQELKGWERRTSKSYCAETGAKYPHLNDSLRNLPEEPEIIRKMVRESIAMISALPKKEAVDHLIKALTISTLIYKSFREYYDAGNEAGFVSDLPPSSRVGMRDSLMRRTINEVLESNPGVSRLATVTGFAHLIINPARNSLYCKSLDLNPTRLVLFD